MSKKWDIVNDEESEYGDIYEVEESAIEDILCDGEGCRHDECDCWDTFRKACAENLKKQDDAYMEMAKSMESLYRGEVNAGIHVPQK